MQEDVTVESLALGERKFLHDVSNQLVVAQGMGSIVLKSLNKSENELDPKVIERLGKTISAIEKMIKMVKERRNTLHSISS